MKSVKLSYFNFIALTETNLDPSVYDAELGLSQYFVFRCARPAKTSSKPSGGSVLLAVHRDFPVSSMQFPCVEIEAVCLKIKLGHNQLLL